jgi:DNA processing protein
MQERDLKYWIWLSTIPKLRQKKRIQLINLYEDPKVIWQMSKKELKSISIISDSLVESFTDGKLREEAEIHLENIKSKSIDVVTYNDETYPYLLKNIHDPPLVLYKKGNQLPDENSIAIVGSRQASFYGLEMAEKLSYELSKYGITIISGMARGVDTFAHNGALKAAGKTVAVLGCGIDIVYPIENKKLMNEINMHGSVISEYLPGTPPIHFNFPARNRIISGMSLGVVVIEAGAKSGSLITADFALEQGREVFAVPGNVTSYNSKGTNSLIRDGAKIVTCIEDILEELSIIINKSKNYRNENKKFPAMQKYSGLDVDEINVVKCLEMGEFHIDFLVESSGLSLQALNSILLMLELKGIIEQIPGKVYKLRSLI